MKAVANRRQHPRRTALFSAKFTVKSGTYRDLVKNVSAGGIFIGSRRMIEHGQRISLRFPVMAFDSKPSVTGTVVRSQPTGFAVMFDQPIEAEICRDGQVPPADVKPGEPK
jgi:Tfp pilus assembly protein PilZ